MDAYCVEMQDNEGNIFYPHGKAETTFLEDGSTVAEQLAKKVNILSSNLTLYVSKTGSDTTGDGTQSAPFLTINKALQYAKISFLNAVVTIIVYDGTYQETVLVENVAGTIEIRSQSGNASAVIIDGTTNNSAVRSGNSTLVLTNVTLTSTPTTGNGVVNIAAKGDVSFSGCVITAKSGSSNHAGIYLYRPSANAYITETQINNCTRAVGAFSGSTAFCNSLSGTGNTYGYYANGAFIFKQGTDPTATTLIAEVNGGKVYS